MRGPRKWLLELARRQAYAVYGPYWRGCHAQAGVRKGCWIGRVVKVCSCLRWRAGRRVLSKLGCPPSLLYAMKLQGFCTLRRGAVFLWGEESCNPCRMVSSLVVVTSCDVAIERPCQSLGSGPAVGGLRSMLVVRLYSACGLALGLLVISTARTGNLVTN